MNIVYATDDNGALGTGVSIVSLMENLPLGVHADIYIMTDGLSGSREGPLQSGSVAARIAQLYLVDVLFGEVCRRDQEGCRLRREMVAEVLSDKHI